MRPSPAQSPSANGLLFAIAAANPRLRRFAAHFAIWALVSLVLAVAVYTGGLRRAQAVSVWPQFSQSLVIFLPWIGFSWLVHEWLAAPGRLFRVVALVKAMVLSVLLFMPLQYTHYMNVQALGDGRALPGPLVFFSAPPSPVFFVYDLTLLIGAFAVVLAWNVFLRNVENQSARQRAESDLLSMRLQLEEQRLERLRAQLEPHFMFNALNAIAGLVRRSDQHAALSAISRLSDLLRYALRASSREWVTLDDECQFLQGYLSLQTLRFGERLQSNFCIDDQARNFLCPPLLLQPLVENAVRHGIEPMRDSGVVEIRAACHDDGLRIVIRNPYPHAASQPGFGIGLKCVEERLALIYHGRAQFEVDAGPTHFTVRLTLVELDDE